MTDKPYTPTTEQVREAYVVGVDPEVTARYRAEFDRWYEAEIAAAERRGAVKALRDAADYLAENKQVVIDGDEYTACNSCTVIQYEHLTYRADQMEGDE